MAKFRKYTADEVKELIERYERGATLREIGETENLTRERIRQIFQKVGYKPRSNTVSERLLESYAKRQKHLSRGVLERLYIGEKKTATEIAAILKCTHHVVYANLVRYDIPRRNSYETSRYNALKYHELNRENLQRWYIEENKNVEQIAEEVSCSIPTVFLRLRKLGIRNNKIYKPRKG